MSTTSPFSAADPTLGYLYQVRSALLWSLRKLKLGSEFLVSVETVDDVTFHAAGGDPIELLQTKHHKKGAGSLTDSSPDLWKTLRVWFEGHASGQVPPGTNLFLVTTGVAPDGTAASRLRNDLRDVGAAEAALRAVASSSTSQTNAKAYEKFLALAPRERAAILQRVIVVDAAPSTTDLDEHLRQEVYWATERDHLSAFLERLEGWWLRRVLRQLADSSADRIGSVEIEMQMSDLREQFKQASLPIDDDLLEFTLDDATRSAHEQSIFVLQLELIKAGTRRISAAIRDYYRAFEQRSRWLRDDLVVGMDLHKYENRLKEEWEIVFDAMRDELGSAATDEAMEKAARAILRWAEQATIAIRASVTEPFVCRGSLHMLADEMHIGWHPEFRERLEQLLSRREAA